MPKFGEDFFNDMVDRGRRELGGLLYPDSNIAQPMYPLRGNYGLLKQSDRAVETEKTDYEDLHPTGSGRDDSERDDRDRGIERE